MEEEKKKLSYRSTEGNLFYKFKSRKLFDSSIQRSSVQERRHDDRPLDVSINENTTLEAAVTIPVNDMHPSGAPATVEPKRESSTPAPVKRSPSILVQKLKSLRGGSKADDMIHMEINERRKRRERARRSRIVSVERVENSRRKSVLSSQDTTPHVNKYHSRDNSDLAPTASMFESGARAVTPLLGVERESPDQ